MTFPIPLEDITRRKGFLFFVKLDDTFIVEAHYWANEHIGYYGINWERTAYHDDGEIFYLYMFKHEEDALFFTMRWK